MTAAVAFVVSVAFGAQASETSSSTTMTVQEHLAAAKAEALLAQQHRDEARRATASKAVVENALRREHLWQAQQHQGLARQQLEEARRVAAK